MYVGDPSCTFLGTGQACSAAADVIIAWWFILGIPLAGAKGVWTAGEHRWIGAEFSISPQA